jgi:aminopeptidase YwaD
MQAAALSQSAAGPAEGALIDAGLGRPEDFSADASGKIALIKRGVLFFEDKVSNAEQAGAAAAIIYNNSSGIFRGSLKDASAIPAVSISEEDGQALLDLMLNAPTPVTVRLDVQTETVIGESQNVVARPREGQCRLIAGGHYDSVPEGPGANDNASGTATVIEIARVLAADGDLDDVCFALFGAEEIGLVGSAHYVAALTADEKGEVEAMLNFDMLGVGDSWPLTGSRGVADVAGAEAERLGISHTVETALPENLGSDHQSFIQAGIPAMIFNCFCDENYHTADDRFELVRGARLAEAGAIALGTISALLGG